MQGIVFTILGDMVIENHGMALWNKIMNSLELESGGAYTSGVQYSDSELEQIVLAIAQELKLPIQTVIRTYGEYLFPKLLSRLPNEQLDMRNLFSFLRQVDEVIHKEVKRLHPDVYLPSFKYEERGEDTLIMKYYSKRKLCSLSEGLIIGAANHFSTKVELKHPQCMHNGAEYCVLEITRCE